MAENKKSFRFYFDKDVNYLISEELENNCEYIAIRRAKYRLRMYANLFIRDLRKVILNETSLCNYCNSKKKLQLDHVVPIAKDGKNHISNIQILCSICNLKKRHF
jgi:5-methylcytosine-specific restriction endonuclease McrA